MVPYRGHCDHCPPIGIKHGIKCSFRFVFFKNKDQRGKDEHRYGHEQKQETQLFVAVSNGKAQTLQAHRMSGQLENPEKRNIEI